MTLAYSRNSIQMFQFQLLVEYWALLLFSSNADHGRVDLATSPNYGEFLSGDEACQYYADQELLEYVNSVHFLRHFVSPYDWTSSGHRTQLELPCFCEDLAVEGQCEPIPTKTEIEWAVGFKKYPVINHKLKIWDLL